jgi:Ni/Co efflux regulator RcnB
MNNNPGYSRGPNGRAFNEPFPGGNPGYTRGPNGRAFNEPSPGANTAYTRGPNGRAFSEPSPGVNPGYTRGPNGGGNFRPQGAPGFAGRPGGFDRPPGEHHDFHGFTDYHQNFMAPRHFHAGAYRRPYGWYSHHWVYDEYLPVAFWSRDYWLIDFMDFGLPPPPYGAVWVRVGDDALLIDQDTGQIITVEYSVFY